MPALLLALLLPSAALAQAPAARAEATDHVYEAADALDQARAAEESGRDAEVQRLLAKAERHLAEALELDPTVPRLAFERARLQRMDNEPANAEVTLMEAMAEDQPLQELVRSVELLDLIREDLGKTPVGQEWQSAQTLRNAGIAVLAGGLGASLAGFAIAFGTFAQEAYTGVTDKGIGGNRFGWGLAIAGGGVALAGGGMTLAGQLQVVRLRRILPGPWRLAALGPPGLYAGGLASSGGHGAVLELAFVLPPAPRTARPR